MIVKTRLQGNSITASFPKYLNVPAGIELEPVRTRDGILFKFVNQEKDIMEFDDLILNDLIKQGIDKDELVNVFISSKKQLPNALELFKNDAIKNAILIRKEDL